MMQHVFIIGSKGIPARYGGFEAFVDKLVEYKKSKNIYYHVACMSKDKKEFHYHGAHCFNIKVPEIGAAKAVYYDLAAFSYCLKYIKQHKISHPIIYILACRIGPFMKYYKHKFEALDGKIYVNPDGQEWQRAKWNFIIKAYWKLSERLMVNNSKLIICDSKSIETQIKQKYKENCPITTYIAYGADTKKSVLEDKNSQLIDWYSAFQLTPYDYYLIVGRFVPENNYEILIKEFMTSDTTRSLVIITNYKNNSFYTLLEKNTKFKTDKRIKFVGTVYEKELLKKIRENAFGYLHGHEVGGTNPSLLEALGSTKLNLLLDVSFNREVGEDGGLYWTKKTGSLCELINKVERFTLEQINDMEKKAQDRIKKEYTWEYIVRQYENTFLQ